MPYRQLGSLSLCKVQCVRPRAPEAGRAFLGASGGAPVLLRQSSHCSAYREPYRDVNNFDLDVKAPNPGLAQRLPFRRNAEVAPARSPEPAVLGVPRQGASSEEPGFPATESDMRSAPAAPGPGSRGANSYPSQAPVYGSTPSTSLAIQPVRLRDL
jgi:hypothetical protein